VLKVVIQSSTEVSQRYTKCIYYIKISANHKQSASSAFQKDQV